MSPRRRVHTSVCTQQNCLVGDSKTATHSKTSRCLKSTCSTTEAREQRMFCSTNTLPSLGVVGRIPFASAAAAYFVAVLKSRSQTIF